ncbi:glycosyl transferase [Paenibacillus macquariensis subsp. defensor]|nr:glycosyl transferase [Paenibacillus macquariensis subsp. defensor]
MKKRLRWQVRGLPFGQTNRHLLEERKEVEQLQQSLEDQRQEQAADIYKLDFEIAGLNRRIEETTNRIHQIQKEAKLQETVPTGGKGRMGEMLVSRGIITAAQLEHVILSQKQYGGRLGDILVDMGFVTSEQMIKEMSDARPKERLGEMLVRSEYITQEQLERALSFQAKSGGMLGDILLSLQMLEPEELYRAVATQNQIGRLGEEIDLNVPFKLPEQWAQDNGVIVVHQYLNRYLVAVGDPIPVERYAELEELLEMPFEQVLATKEELEHLFSSNYGNEMLKQSTSKLKEQQPENSASTTFTFGQIMMFAIVSLSIIVGLIWNVWGTILVVNLLIQLFYFIMTVFKFAIIYLGSRTNSQLRFTPEEIAALDEKSLPIYTILVPMYKEAGVIPHLIRNLERLDYPKAKLDVRLLIEDDDIETKELLSSMNLPAYYTTLVVPDSLPKTKPKACNYGLIRARGEYAVIYDAEDQPDADQLKKVMAAFNSLPEEYVCIQAKLNYFNSSQNLLTRWFTQEYSMWFELLLPGIMKLDMPVPLGGTSNHFKVSVLKDINAWDPYNVTEDADLGIRLYKSGYKTAIIDSRTWEEANSQVGNWIRQRSRWIKGYMQTWLVHMRNPLKLIKEIGLKGFLGFQVMILATPLLPLLNPIFWVMILLWFGWEAEFIPKLFPGYLYYLAGAEFYVANFLFIFSNVAGVYWVINDMEEKGEKRFSFSLVKYGLTIPLYWVLMSIAAIKAAWQLITKPFYWEKTVHGLTEMNEENLLQEKL